MPYFLQVATLLPQIHALYGASTTAKPHYGHTPVYHPKPKYHPPHAPRHGYSPAPHPPYGHGHHMPGHPPKPPTSPDYGPPGCAKNHTQHYCLDDYEYPVYETIDPDYTNDDFDDNLNMDDIEGDFDFEDLLHYRPCRARLRQKIFDC